MLGWEGIWPLVIWGSEVMQGAVSSVRGCSITVMELLDYSCVTKNFYDVAFMEVDTIAFSINIQKL